jgi:carbon storage regulator CsrA
MLVLKRKLGTKIYIDGGAITLTVVEAQCGFCKIGIEAPPGVSVLREELAPDGPTHCCWCGGLLPPADATGVRVKASTGCQGRADPVSDRCQAFAASALWGDAPPAEKKKDGAA